MADTNDEKFTAPAEEHEFAALLFDMDGTIIDSTEAVVKHWHTIGAEIGVPGEEILRTSHGRRSIDVLALLAPDRANWEYIHATEGLLPINYATSALALPGSHALLEALNAATVPWAIVTSGSRPLVEGWLKVLQLEHPPVLVTAEDVPRGKPDPGCYALGWERLVQERLVRSEEELKGGRKRVLVLEDAPAGVKAGKAAGFEVVALATTHGVEELKVAGADWVVRDLRSVVFRGWDRETGLIKVEIVEGWSG